MRHSAAVALLEHLIDRRPEAERVADFILAAKHRFVVLHGKSGSGKTELIKRWVIPALQAAREQQGYDVLYGSCGRGLPEVLEGTHDTVPFDGGATRKCILFLDNFEYVLDLSRDERREVLDRLFERLQAKDAQAITVLVTDTRQLTSIYALTSYEAEIASAVREVPSVGIAEGLVQLSAIEPDTAVAYSAEVLQRMSEDSARMDVTFDLVTILDARFRRLRNESGTRSVDLPTYEQMDGLAGILRAHLEGQVEQLETEAPGSREIVHAILARVLDARAEGAAAQFADIPPRLGVSSQELETVLARLAQSGGLLRSSGTGVYQLVPPQLGQIIEADIAKRARENEHLHRVVEEGLRSWQQLGTLLPQARFEEVHRARTHLIVPTDQISFLLRCALRYESPNLPHAAAYWLRRVGERMDGVDILLASVLADFPDVRARSAALLREFPEPEVRTRLQILALTDPDPDVRAQAVSSLEPMRDQAMMEQYIQEARNSRSVHRAAAIEALRLFSDGPIATVLQALVNDPKVEEALREKAIGTLGALNMPQAVDALVDIALHDHDEEDRRAAAEALASIQREDLNQHILSTLRVPSTAARIWLTRIVLGSSGVLAAFIAFSLCSLGGAVVVLYLLALVVSLPLLLPTRALLVRLRDQRVKRASPAGVLGAGLFMFCTVFILAWVHGLAHLITGRPRRALLLFGAEVLSIPLFVEWPLVAMKWPGLGWLYLLFSVFLFVGSFGSDIVGVLFDTLVLTDTTRLERRRAAIYEKVFTNRIAAELVFRALTSRDHGEAAWASEIFERFGAHVQLDQLIDMLRAADPVSLPPVLASLERTKTDATVSRLETLWGDADQELRRRIATILYRSPNERSVEALDRLRHDMSPLLTLRSGLARGYFWYFVWPRPVRIAVWALILVGFGLLYHGYNVIANPAWSQIMILKQPTIPGNLIVLSALFASDDKKVKVVHFLADAYPKESEKELLYLFRAERKRGPDPFEAGRARRLDSVHAAIAQALVRIHDTLDLTELRDELLSAAGGFGDFLAVAEPTEFARALGVLRTIANSRDPVLGDTAVRVLSKFIRTGDDSARRILAVDSLGSLAYGRALPALDTLFMRQPLGLVKDQIAIEVKIDTTMSRVAWREFWEMRLRNTLARDGKKLDAVLSTLRHTAPISKVRQRLALEFKRDDDERRAQAKRETEQDAKNMALQDIRDDPSSERGYRQLLNQYLGDKRYRDAQNELIRLKKQYPASLWPRKVLSELYHEYMAVEDTTWFQPSYAEMAALRELPAYRQLKTADTADYYRFEVDFAEVTLSARKYAETESVAQELLAITQRDYYRLNLALFIYMGYVMQGKRDPADAKLAQLEEVIRTLPENFYNNWQYPGTVAFIAASGWPEELRTALLKLCKEAFWYDREEAARVVAENRAALKLLPQQ